MVLVLEGTSIGIAPAVAEPRPLRWKRKRPGWLGISFAPYSQGRHSLTLARGGFRCRQCWRSDRRRKHPHRPFGGVRCSGRNDAYMFPDRQHVPSAQALSAPAAESVVTEVPIT